MRRAPFVGYKIPAPASAHCAMQSERSRYASASFKPFGERGGAGDKTTNAPCPSEARCPCLGEIPMPARGAISPKQGRRSETSAQRLGLGGTPGLQPEKRAIPAQRPCWGEIGARKIPPWERRGEGPPRLPAGTPRPSPARTGEFLPSRDVAQKSGRFRAPTAKFLPSKDDGPILRRNVLAWEKRRRPPGGISPKAGRWSAMVRTLSQVGRALRLHAKDGGVGRDKARQRQRRAGAGLETKRSDEKSGAPAAGPLRAGSRAENYLKWWPRGFGEPWSGRLPWLPVAG